MSVGPDDARAGATGAIPESAARYDAWYQSPIGKAMDAAESRAVMEMAAPVPGERALDVGCGTGIYTARLLERGAVVTGVDSDAEMLAAARVKAPGATFVTGDATALDLPDDSFDLVLAVTLLCFASDPQVAVEEMVRVTRPGGRIVVADLGRYSLWAAWRRLKGLCASTTWEHARFFTSGELTHLLQLAGAQELHSATTAYLPPFAGGHFGPIAHIYERQARRFGDLGAAFVLARGIAPGPGWSA